MAARTGIRLRRGKWGWAEYCCFSARRSLLSSDRAVPSAPRSNSRANHVIAAPHSSRTRCAMRIYLSDLESYLAGLQTARVGGCGIAPDFGRNAARPAAFTRDDE